MATIIGTFRSERLLGTRFDDLIEGGDGDDTLVGKDGPDKLFGGIGNDRIKGGNGADHVSGGEDDDKLFGLEGLDHLVGGNGNDRVVGGAGSDILSDGAGADTLVGGEDADLFTLQLDASQDRIRDYEKGQDWLRLEGLTSLGFDDLTLTTVRPGKVEIKAGGDTLIVRDRVGTLTAEDIQIASFAVDDTARTSETVPIVIDVLANDFGDDLTLTGLDTTGTVGRAILKADGRVSYEAGDLTSPVAGETVIDTFIYEAVDSLGRTTSATVSVTIDGEPTPPKAEKIELTVFEDTQLTFDLLDGVTDPDTNDADLSFEFDFGTAPFITPLDESRFIFDAESFDRLAQDEEETFDFTYSTADSEGGASSNTVSITVVGVNDDPVAEDFSASFVGQDQIIGIIFGNVRSGVSDIDGDDLFFSGDVNEFGEYSFQLIAAPGDSNRAFVDYTVMDGFGGVDSATVTVLYTNFTDDPIP